MGSNEKTIEKFNSHVAQSYGRYPLAMKKGQGRRCVDENGKEYVDLGSGIGVNSLGFCDEKWRTPFAVRFVLFSITRIIIIPRFRLNLQKSSAMQQAMLLYFLETAVRKPMNALLKPQENTASINTVRADIISSLL